MPVPSQIPVVIATNSEEQIDVVGHNTFTGSGTFRVVKMPTADRAYLVAITEDGGRLTCWLKLPLETLAIVGAWIKDRMEEEAK